MRVNEENFISLLRNKKEKALDYVIDNYGGLIKYIVKKELYNLENVQGECINDILLAIWSNSDKYDETRSTFKNWIIGICKFKSMDFKRKYLKDICNEDIDNVEVSIPDNVHLQVVRNEIDNDVEALLQCLNHEDRQIFIKLYVEEKELDDVSNEVGLKKSVIYNRLSRGKKKIREQKNIIQDRRY